MRDIDILQHQLQSSDPSVSLRELVTDAAGTFRRNLAVGRLAYILEEIKRDDSNLGRALEGIDEVQLATAIVNALDSIKNHQQP